MFELPDKLKEMVEFRSWNALHVLRGSHSYGTNTPETTDIDTFAVVIPRYEWYYGLNEFGSKGTKEIKHGDWDIVCYEFCKFVSMLSQGNPNVMGVLWCDDSDFLNLSRAGRELINQRHLFVGKHAVKAFFGFVEEQVKKTTRIDVTGKLGAKRKELVDKHGYDCKNMHHAIRLLRMLRPYFETGNLVVRRPDAAELIDIKQGKWSLDRCMEEVGRLMEDARKAEQESTLPDDVNRDAISWFCSVLVREELEERYKGRRGVAYPWDGWNRSSWEINFGECM